MLVNKSPRKRAFDLYKFSMISKKYSELIHKQDYSKKQSIDGVILKELSCYNDDGGSFCEIFKLNNDKPLDLHIDIKQSSWSIVEPNVIKAFHIHKKQFDLWFVPPSEKLLIGLFDVRENSESYETKMRFVMGSGKAQLLLIPNGVAHGYANLTSEKQSLIYFTSEKFNINDNDEYRLPWNVLGEDFWQMRKE